MLDKGCKIKKITYFLWRIMKYGDNQIHEPMRTEREQLHVAGSMQAGETEVYMARDFPTNQRTS